MLKITLNHPKTTLKNNYLHWKVPIKEWPLKNSSRENHCVLVWAVIRIDLFCIHAPSKQNSRYHITRGQTDIGKTHFIQLNADFHWGKSEFCAPLRAQLLLLYIMEVTRSGPIGGGGFCSTAQGNTFPSVVEWKGLHRSPLPSVVQRTEPFLIFGLNLTSPAG